MDVCLDFFVYTLTPINLKSWVYPYLQASGLS